MAVVNLDQLPPHIQTLVTGLLGTALIARENEIPKDKYMLFCEETWETMQMNDLENLKAVLLNYAFKKARKM